MSENKPLPKIEPLCEDLYKIIGPKFLLSIEFKRWLIENKFSEPWNDILKLAKRNSWSVAIYGNRDEAYAHDALIMVLNSYYRQREYRELVNFVNGILKTYSEKTKLVIDISFIKKDLLVAGIDEELITTLEEVNASVAEEKSIESINQNTETVEEKIRLFEEKYKTEAKKEANSEAAISAYLKWHSTALRYLSQFYSNSNSDYARFKSVDNSGNGYVLQNNFHELYSIYNLLMDRAGKEEMKMASEQKTPMIFISHSSKDKAFVESLVELLESFGFDEKTLFCSSVDGYGIGLGDNVFNTLKNLFLEHDLYVLFIHSPRYYDSAVCLNEMGAAWVLKTNYFSFLTKDMSFDMMKGVVDSSDIAIKVDADDAKARLNELKDKLLEAFGFDDISQTKWDRKRDRFLESVLK